MKKQTNKTITQQCDIPIKLIGSNQRLIPSRYRWVASPKYRECKKELIELFKKEIKEKMSSIEVKISINKREWKGDIDNISKVILDAIQEAEIISNDKNIYKLTIERDNTTPTRVTLIEKNEEI